MKKRMVVAGILFFVLIFGIVISHGNVFDEGVPFEMQLELIYILFNQTPNDIAEILSERGERVSHGEIPNVVGIGWPQNESESFFIMLEDKVTQELKDFVLAFTGIPEEKAEFDQLLSVDTPMCTADISDYLFHGFYLGFFENSCESFGITKESIYEWLMMESEIARSKK